MRIPYRSVVQFHDCSCVWHYPPPHPLYEINEYAFKNDWGSAGGGGRQLTKLDEKSKKIMIFELSLPIATKIKEKVYFRSQILECPSIGQYWNIFGVPVLPENVILTFFRTCWCYSEAYNTGTQKWSSIVQYSCTSIWDLKYTFSKIDWQKC